jgi:hypothetical protein
MIDCNHHSRGKQWKRLPDGNIGDYRTKCKSFFFIGDDPQYKND